MSRGYGTEFYFAGLRQQDAHKLKSFEGVDICWVEEAHVVTKKSWDILVPTIRKPLSEIWVTFNPELDSDETYQRFVVNPQPDSIVVRMNWDKNPWFPEVLRKEMVALESRDPEAHRNVWLGECRSAVEGAIYAREIAAALEGRRVRPVPYDALLKVHSVWDLGWNDKTAILLVQRVSSEIRVIEYLEDSHRTLAEYVADLESRRYRWGTDYLPHDARAKDYKSGKSAEEMLLALGRKVEIVENLGIEAGIKAARQLFPRCYFDEDKSKGLIHCLKRYRRAINQTTNEPGPPLHDDASHGADAFRYLAVAADQMTNDDLGEHDPYRAWR